MRVFGGAVPAGCWQVTQVVNVNAERSQVSLEGLLAEGWEPFAVHDFDVWLRRVVVDDPRAAALVGLGELDAETAQDARVLERGRLSAVSS